MHICVCAADVYMYARGCIGLSAGSGADRGQLGHWQFKTLTAHPSRNVEWEVIYDWNSENKSGLEI